MTKRKLTRSRFLSMLAAALVLVGLVITPSAGVASPQPPVDADQSLDGPAVLPTAASPVRVDEEGYTLWGGPVEGHWCVPVTGIRYPIDLGQQDPTQLSDSTLELKFAHRKWIGDIKDPSWTVLFNGHDAGAISGPITTSGTVLNPESIAVDPDWIVDGQKDKR